MKRPDDFFNTFNARHLNPKQVAETFIWSDNFGKLILNNHSVILGARGCGKTTLMKMLTLPALHYWKNTRAKKIKSSFPFYAVYISTDIYWDVKNQTYSSQLEGFQNFATVISTFSVNSNIFLALCDTFKSIIELELKSIDEKKEIELCKVLIEAWKLKATVPKLDYVKEALNKRIDTVNQLIQDVIFNYGNEKSLPKEDFFNLSFESSLEYIIPIFERIYGLNQGKKWALCFDELEFAPLWLQQKLFRSLRSRQHYILYKLSASPILPSDLEKELTGEYSPTSGNDVQMIKMWASEDNEKFSRQIINSLLSSKVESKNSSTFFGSNHIHEKSFNSYEAGSEFYNEITQLLSKDDSFKLFLESKKININNPVATNKKQKDTVFRKIKPIVYFRNYYIDGNILQSDGKQYKTLRGRKTGENLYSGIEVLSKICDGNPRWLIGIVTGILLKCNGNKADTDIQYEELLSAAKRFKNVISNIPIGFNCSCSLIDLIDKMGNYFTEQVLGPEFHMDPKLTFIVDQKEKDVPEDMITLIEKGVAQGAFILLDDKDDAFDFNVRNKRFKLSYLFFMLYKLPIRKYPAVKLSQCLKNIKSDVISQASLFE